MTKAKISNATGIIARIYVVVGLSASDFHRNIKPRALKTEDAAAPRDNRVAGEALESVIAGTRYRRHCGC